MAESKLARHDQDLERLRDAHPGWRVWYVPTANQGTFWCGHPLPVLNCHSPEELESEITSADADRSAQ